MTLDYQLYINIKCCAVIKTLGQMYLRNYFRARSRCAQRPILSVFLNTVLLNTGTCSNFEIIIIIFERENIGSGTTKAASALRKS